jgi:hypothetical protein
LEFPERGLAVTESSSGLLVATTAALYIIESESLNIKARLAIANLQKLASSPVSSVAFAIQMNNDSGRLSRRMVILDLKSNSIVRSIAPLEDRTHDRVGFGRYQPPTNIAVDPTGKQLLVHCRQIRRYRIDGHDLWFEDSTREYKPTAPSHFSVSLDGRRVGMYSAMIVSRNGTVDAAGETTYIFGSDALGDPQATVARRVMGIAVDSDQFYLFEHPSQLLQLPET